LSGKNLYIGCTTLFPIPRLENFFKKNWLFVRMIEDWQSLDPGLFALLKQLNNLRDTAFPGSLTFSTFNPLYIFLLMGIG
jgi:hypothetical protein